MASGEGCTSTTGARLGKKATRAASQLARAAMEADAIAPLGEVGVATDAPRAATVTVGASKSGAHTVSQLARVTMEVERGPSHLGRGRGHDR